MSESVVDGLFQVLSRWHPTIRDGQRPSLASYLIIPRAQRTAICAAHTPSPVSPGRADGNGSPAETTRHPTGQFGLPGGLSLSGIACLRNRWRPWCETFSRHPFLSLTPFLQQNRLARTASNTISS